MAKNEDEVKRSLIEIVRSTQSIDLFKKHNWTGTLDQYFALLRENPLPTRKAWARLRDRISELGYDTVRIGRKELRD